MNPEFSGLALAAGSLAIFARAVVQGSIGFGLAVVSVPVLAIVVPEAVPATLLILAVPTTAWMAWRERHALDRTGFLWILAGRIPGTVLGALVLRLVPTGSQAVLFGAAVVVATLGSLLVPPFEPTPARSTLAGFVSGTMGTSSALGGPALGLLYQRRAGAQLRATLALSFLVGIVFSLAGVAFAQRLRLWHLGVALKLLPAMVLGLVVSNLGRRTVDRHWLRPAVLGFAAFAGVLAIARGLIL